MSSTVSVSRRRLTLSTGVQVGGRIVGAVLGVLVAASLARSLSRPAFGEFALALTITTLAGSLTDLGIDNVAVREMSRRPHERASIAGALSTVRLITGVGLMGVGYLACFLLMSGSPARVMAAFVMATLPLGAVNALAMASQARLRPELVIMPTLVQSVVWLAAVLTLSLAHAGLALYGVGFLVAAIMQSAATLVLATRVTEISFSGTGPLIRELLRVSWPIGLAGMFVTAYYRIDGVLLFHYRGATANAYYSAAYRVLDVLQILPITVGSVLLPLLAGADDTAADAARGRRVFELAVIILLAVAVPAAVLGGILAPGVISLVYGSHFHRSVLLLQILLPAFIPICLGYALTSQLILHGLLRPYIIITLAGAIINVAVNAVGIPIWGAPVAAWATVGTEFVVMSLIATVVARGLHLRLPFGRIVRCLAATTVTAVFVWPVRSSPVEVGILVAAVVYPPVLLASRAISVSELRALLTREVAAQA